MPFTTSSHTKRILNITSRPINLVESLGSGTVATEIYWHFYLEDEKRFKIVLANCSNTMPRIVGMAKEVDGLPTVTSKVRRNAIKKEVEAPGEQQVYHRKSERRRVARDIFLVFEEQSTRRSKGSSKKKGPQKPKFGHLKVEDPGRPKGFLRDIKNECSVVTQRCLSKSRNSAMAVKKPTLLESANGEDQIARVNPIFLWVKQDDTRIVEVRCEDYDKRNRIRITKTTNGWRAIPRTDPTSSKIVKVFQTPLLKVKREVHESNKFDQSNDYPCPSVQKQSLADKPKDCSDLEGDRSNTLNCDLPTNIVAKRSSHTRRKKKSKKSKTKTENNRSSDSGDVANTSNIPLNSLVAEELAAETIKPIPKCLETSDGNNEANEEIKSVNSETNNEKDKNKDTNIDANAENKFELETYQDQGHLQLCPKTGLFLPNNHNHDHDEDTSETYTQTSLLTKNIFVELTDCQAMCEEAPGTPENQAITEAAEKFDADTKNLKDLLDDADLLQHCGDNAISDTEIIDSLVKRSCENNLLQEADSLNKASTEENAFAPLSDNLLEKPVSVTDIPQLIDTVSEPPKCLSFNEAGEIEGLNGELFQPNSYIDAFEKPSVTEERHSVSKKNDANPEILGIAEEHEKLPDVIIDDSPKDLTYKKREEVCPPSESRSQCAVTSSSDIVKSPQPGAIPVIDTTSDAIKSLILEQFIKLNALNTIPAPMSKQQQLEPIDLGKHVTASKGSSLGYGPTTNYIETVVIDDNSDEEPVKKRFRNTAKHGHGVGSEESTAPSIIDKDPDPLTQLQLLIRNTQWKVPDPILVPKDRLAAVLASPAREIPLLITTRPELRLPEAFAYPEIIQNPNILVISMAQLEAILRNEMELDKKSAEKLQHQHHVTPNNAKAEKIKQLKLSETGADTSGGPTKESNLKCSHADSSLASDINAATLAVLNQMLWIPYFGQLSQEFIKTLKAPLGVPNKYSLLPLYNPHLGLQHLDELYKGYLKQMSSLKNLNEDAVNNPLANCPGSVTGYPSPMEVAVFQKLLQHQMQNFLNMNPLSSEMVQKETHLKNSTSDVTSLIEKIKATQEKQSTNPLTATPVQPSQLSTIDHNGGIGLAERALRLRNVEASCDNPMKMVESIETNRYSCVQKQESENKPRLTCKSLSNLLEPETAVLTSAALSNLSSDSIRSISRESNNNKQVENKSIKDAGCIPASDSVPLASGSGRLGKTVSNLHNAHELTKQQRKRNINYMEVAHTPEQIHRGTEILNIDSNPGLWHPLFGSNTKASYSSPWQWTTVTATGE